MEDKILQEEKKGQQSGTNTGLPFGLCAKYGIRLLRNATPRDEWSTLEDKTGLTPEQVYKDLREKEQAKREGAKHVYDDAYDSRNDFAEQKRRVRSFRQNASYESILRDKRNVQNGHVLETVPREKRAEYIQDELGVSFQDAEKYSEALYFYTDDFDNVKNIRAYQRGETVKNTSEVAKQEQALEDYVKRAPKWNGGETFRGVKLSETELSQYVEGSEHNMLGTSSWSSDEDTAIGYAGYGKPPSGKRSAVFHSSTQKNGTSVRHLSPFSNEDEVLVSKRSKYRVLKVIKSQDGISHIYLEEV